jgi:hypothetical protein
MVGVLVLSIVEVCVGAEDAEGEAFTKTVNGVGDNWMTSADL